MIAHIFGMAIYLYRGLAVSILIYRKLPIWIQIPVSLSDSLSIFHTVIASGPWRHL